MASPLTRISLATALAALAGACTNSPAYVSPPQALEVGLPDPANPGETIDIATAQLMLPVRLETMAEAEDRLAREAELGLALPVVGLEDLDITIEWTIKNLSDQAGTARVQVNGGNEFFYYVPLNFVFDPDEDEEPPPLLGNVPIDVPAEGTVSGVFREDQLTEAAIDLELITRGALNPFAAVLDDHADIEELTGSDGVVVPREAFGHMVQYDLVLLGNRHMVLEYNIRVRDPDELMHERLLQAPADELTVFMPAEYVPAPPMEPAAR
ncbi:hypothetical protein [Haliangium sp.]|uniref:hypothetical protein n=1 Tax=Haliangium sp. TaxID=2663208 RepID=UPI003D0B5EE6